MGLFQNDISLFRLEPLDPFVIFNFHIIGISGRSAVLSFVSWIILSLVEALIIQMLFSHLLHCHTAYIPKNLVVFRILPENSIFLNSHLLMFLPTYRKHVQKYLLQIHLNIWLQNYFQLQNILPTIYGIFYFPRLILRFFFFTPHFVVVKNISFNKPVCLITSLTLA